MTTPSTDTGYAPQSWAFDKEVTRVFDNMLDRSIPALESMRRAVDSLVHYQLEKAPGRVLDIGASNGGAIANAVALHPEANFVGIENSQPMVEQFRKRFSENKNVGVIEGDVRTDAIPFGNTVTLSVLTLMFTPIDDRQKLVNKLYQNAKVGGMLIVVEKCLGATPTLNDLFVNRYYGFKRASGYSDEEIERKRLSLQGVLVPQTVESNISLIESAGFQHVETFWRWMNFAGFVAFKTS